jgi:hypothetical protein
MRIFQKSCSYVLAIAVASFSIAGIVPNRASAFSNGLGVSPRRDFNVTPGQKLEETLIVTNPSPNQQLKIRIEVIDFKAKDNSGTPELLTGANPEQVAWSIKSFVTLPAEFTVEPQGTGKVPISINVPAEQGAGTYYSAIRYTTQQEASTQTTPDGTTQGGGAAVSASNNTLLFLRVSGKVSEQLILDTFKMGYSREQAIKKLYGVTSIEAAEQKIKLDDEKIKKEMASTSAFGAFPDSYLYSVKNSGNVAEQPAGTIILKNMFGDIVYETNPANPKKELALRGQTRLFEVCIKDEMKDNRLVGKCIPQKVKMPGRYTAELSLLYGENGQETKDVTATVSFWYLPMWFNALVLLLLLGVAGGGWMIFSKTKKQYAKKTK